MTTAWLTDAGDDDLLDLGELSPIAPETRPTTTLDVSPLGEISPVDANRRRVPAARAGSKPFPFAPSPVVKGATSAAQATAAFPRSPAVAPSPLAPKRAAQREPTKDSPGTLAGAATAPMLGGSRLAVAAEEHVPNKKLSSVDPPRGGGLSRHSRRQSLGLDAFQSITKGLLEEDDDFDFAPSFTPKAAKGPGAFAPSPVREEEEEEEEEEEKEEEDAVAEEEEAGPLEGIVEEEEEAEVADAEVAEEEEVADEAAAARAAREPPASEAAREEAPVAPEPPAAEAEAEDAFERRLRAAMEAAERGGGLASLTGGMQNSPPGGKPSAARPAASLESVPDAVPDADEVDPRQHDATDAQENASEDSEEVHSDDDTVELRADVDVSMMDAEPFPRAPTPVSRGTAGDAPRAPAAVLAALASPASGVKEPSRSTPTSREEEKETETAKLPTANGDDAPSESARNETAETEDAFERRLLAAMEAAERGGGLAGLSGGMQNSPPGSKPTAFRPPVANSPPGDEARQERDAPKEDDARASGPVPDEREGKREAEATAAEKPRRSAKAKATTKTKAKAPIDPDPEPETKGSAPSERASADDDAFERKLLAAMEAAERGGGLAGLSGGMQNSPPGSKPAKPTGAAAAAEIPSPEPETVDGDAEDVCGMDHDAPPTPKEPAGALAPSPAPPAASAKKRDAKPPRSGKKSKRARTPSLRAPEEKEEEALEEGDEEEGPSPPAADFEAMLAKAMAAADGGNVDAVLGGASRKTMNSPAPPRRKTPARSAKAKTPEGTPMRETRSSARVTRASAAKTKTRVAHRNVQNTPTPRGKKRGSSPTPEKRKKLGAAKPAWVSDVTPDPEPEEAAKEETAEENASLDRSSSDGSGSEDVSPVPEAPAAPPPPPAAWIKKTAEAKTSLKPAWVSEFAAPAAAPAAPVVAAPVAPVAAPVVIAALAAAQSRAKAASLSSDGFDFEAKLQAALAAEAGGGAAAFGGASKVANSPTGSGEKRTEFSAKEEARRQGVTVAQIMHARAHADSSPLTKVRF